MHPFYLQTNIKNYYKGFRNAAKFLILLFFELLVLQAESLLPISIVSKGQ